MDSELWDDEVLVAQRKNLLSKLSLIWAPVALQAFCSVMGLFKEILVLLTDKSCLGSLAQLLKSETDFLVVYELL